MYGSRNKTMINLPITLHLLRRLELLRTSACVHPLARTRSIREYANNPWSIHVPDVVCVVFTVHIVYCTLIHGIAFYLPCIAVKVREYQFGSQLQNVTCCKTSFDCARPRLVWLTPLEVLPWLCCLV